MTSCPKCGLQFSDQTFTSVDGRDSCPNCQTQLTSSNLVEQYFQDLWQIITRPTLFFRRMPLSGGLSHPLAFALITHWLGSAAAFLWRGMFGEGLRDVFNRFFRIASDVVEIDGADPQFQWVEAKDRIIHWFWGVGSVITDPFLTLASILFTSFLVYLAARIFVTPGRKGAPREISYESAVRLICFGMSPSILAAIPLVGNGVASICVIIVTVIGAKEIYRISTGRAIVVALFPKLAYVAVFLMLIAFFLLFIAKIFFSMMWV